MATMMIKEAKLSAIISEYLPKDEDVTKFLFSVSHPMWEEVIETYLTMHGPETVLFACKWAKITECAIVANATNYMGDICDFALSAVVDIYNESDINTLKNAYNLLMAIWECAEILPYPFDIIEKAVSKIDTNETNVDEILEPMPLPYS